MKRTLTYFLLALGPLYFNGYEANACGGCFQPQPPPQVQREMPQIVTDHRMVLAITGRSTTLWDQIRYSGDPQQFIWVLPIRSARDVQIGLGDNAFIDAVDRASAPSIQGIARCGGGGFGSGGGGCSPSAGGLGLPASLNGTESASLSGHGAIDVGPFSAQVVSAREIPLERWLPREGFVVPRETLSAITYYDTLSFDYIVLRMRPGQGVRQIQPVRVSYPGAAMALPLRMIVAGSGDSVGLSLMVFANSVIVPVNFPSRSIPDADLQFDFSRMRSNYVALTNTILTPNSQTWLIETADTIAAPMVSFRPSSNAATRSGALVGGPPIMMGTDPDAGVEDSGAVDPDMHGPIEHDTDPTDAGDDAAISTGEDAADDNLSATPDVSDEGATSEDVGTVPDALDNDGATVGQSPEDSATTEPDVTSVQDAEAPVDVPNRPMQMFAPDPFGDLRFLPSAGANGLILTRLRARLNASALNRDLILASSNIPLIPVARTTTNVTGTTCPPTGGAPIAMPPPPARLPGCSCSVPVLSPTQWLSPASLMAVAAVLAARRLARRRVS